MLYPQIPKNILKKIAMELNINIGVFNITFKEKQSSEDILYDKLHLVVKYMEDHLDIGTIDSPGDYFRGFLPMRWGPFGYGNSEMIYFGGITSSGTVLGLGGSSFNVIGEVRGHSRPHSHSGTPAIISKLKTELDNPESDKTKKEIEHTGGTSSQRHSDSFYQQCVYLASTQMTGPIENFEFLARRLIVGNKERSLIVLGTPIYVAYTDKQIT